MKTLLVLTLLVALIGLGVWNSPKMETHPVGSVVESVDITGSVLDGRGLSNAVIMEWHDKPMVDEAVPFVYAAKLSDFKTQEQFETDYSQIYLPGAEMQDVSTYRDATPIGEDAPENHEIAYSGLWGRSQWEHALSSKSAPDGDRHAY